MSGESFRAMMVRGRSIVTSVLSGAGSSGRSQPSSKRSLSTGSKRACGFDTAPRPRRVSPSAIAPGSRLKRRAASAAAMALRTAGALTTASGLAFLRRALMAGLVLRIGVISGAD